MYWLYTYSYIKKFTEFLRLYSRNIKHLYYAKIDEENYNTKISWRTRKLERSKTHQFEPIQQNQCFF